MSDKTSDSSLHQTTEEGVGTQFSKQDIEIISRKNVFDGFFKMEEYQFKHRLFEGGWSKVVKREIFERGHAVAVLPYDLKRAEFVLIEQIRIGALPTRDNPWLIEIIAGMIEPNESAEDVCIREAKEESGVDLTHLSKALSYLSSPGGTSERLHIYMAQVDSSTAAGVHGLEYESEDIKVHRVPEQLALDWVESGVIDNAAAIIAIQWFMINKQKLLAEWRKADDKQ